MMPSLYLWQIQFEYPEDPRDGDAAEAWLDIPKEVFKRLIRCYALEHVLKALALLANAEAEGKVLCGNMKCEARVGHFEADEKSIDTRHANQGWVTLRAHAFVQMKQPV